MKLTNRITATLEISAVVILTCALFALTPAGATSTNHHKVESVKTSCTPAADRNCSGGYYNGYNFTNENLQNFICQGCNFGSAIFTNTDLSGADLTGSDFSGSPDFTNTILKNTILTGANMGNANLQHVKSLQGVISGQLEGGASYPQSWNVLNGYLVGPAANLSDAPLSNVNFSNFNLDYVRFDGANLTSANFTQCSLNHASFGISKTGKFSTLSHANFEDANLNGAQFTAANLTKADFTGAHLAYAIFSGPAATPTNLTGADLSSTDVTAAKFNPGFSLNTAGGAILQSIKSGDMYVTDPTLQPSLPAKWQFVDGYFVGSSSNSGAPQFGADLSRASLVLERSNLKGIFCTRCWLTAAALLYSNLEGATLDYASGKYADFSYSKLNKVSATGAVFDGAKFFATNLKSANFSGASLLNANLSEIVANSATTFQSADLRGADLRGADLSGADFSGANLKNAQFSPGAFASMVTNSQTTCPSGSAGPCTSSNPNSRR
jgi:uncharacterized protein YjbI with pentapeptide repeats